MSRFTTLVSLALLASTVVAQGGIGQLYSSSPLISGVGTLGINQPGQALVDAESVINVLGPFGCAKNYVIGVNSTLDAGKLVHACLCLEVLNSADNACPTCQPHAQPICGAANGCGCKCEVGYVATSDGTCVPDTVCTSPNKIDSSGPGSPTCACAVGSIPGPSLTGGCIIITPSSSMPPRPSSSSMPPRPSSSSMPPPSSSSMPPPSSSSMPPPSSSSVPPPSSSSVPPPSSSSVPPPSSSSMPPPSSSSMPPPSSSSVPPPSSSSVPPPSSSSVPPPSSSSSMPPVTTTTITFPSEPPMTLPTPVFSSTSTSSSSSSSFCATLTITLTKTKTVYEPTSTYFSPIPWTTLYSTYTPPGTTTTTTSSSAMSSVTPAPSSSMSVSSVTTTSSSIVTKSSSSMSYTSVPPTTSSSVPAMTTTMSSLPPCATLGRRQRRSGGSVIGNLVNNGTFTGGFLCAYGDAGPIGLEGSGYGELQPTPTAVVIPHVTFCMTMGESACPQSDGSFTCYNTQTSSAACGGCIGQGGVVCSASQKCVNSTCQ